MSALTQTPLIPDPGPSTATPGLWNRTFSVLSANLDTVNATAIAGGQAVQTIRGTANQINPSSTSTGNVTLSFPSGVTMTSLEVTSGISTSALTINGPFVVTSTLSVGGLATFESALTAVGDLRSLSSLTVAGNAIFGSSVTAGRESYASAIYITCPLKPALSSVMDFGYADVQIGMFRSGNSSTLRFSGGTFREEGSGMDVSVITSRSDVVATKKFRAGLSGNVGAYQFSFDNSGMVQNSSGYNFQKNASPATVRFGLDGSGNTVFIGTGVSDSTYGFHVAAVDMSLTTSTLNLGNSPLLSMRTIASATSLTLAVGELAIALNVTSGASLAFRSGGTVWFPGSSLSTVG